ncbi:MAG: hypothetical protein Q9M28_10795, partial [Mariprofundaceae bacterium]|nr:hypothetical protein [Mariprofundaceae bacterium]
IFRQLNQQYPELHDQLHTRRTLQLKEVQDFIRDNLPSLMTEIQLESQLKDIQQFIEEEL